jgi:EAL domain-containing protein (putative c-di-GMP-specific phosphodiesterase class I)
VHAVDDLAALQPAELRAEGHAELLGALGVDLAQGFHIGRPRPVEELR